MSSPETEKFEITDEDLLNEFNPNRPTYRQSKNKATYGIWAEDSDDEGAGRPGFGKSGKQRKSYTAPIGFVSGGVKVGDKVTKDDAGDGIDDSDSDAEYDRAALAEAMARKRGPPGRPPPASTMAGSQGNASVGGWERHTKGLGSKLMEKMGYVPGKGLGKNLHGIQTPVEAKLRGGKGTVGYHGSERTVRSKTDFPAKPDSDEEDQKLFQQQLQQWKKAPAEGKKKKPKYVYRTADELIKDGGSTKSLKKQERSELSKVKVIDMTGKEQRVLSGYHAIAHKHDMPEEEPPLYNETQDKKAFDMPELLHNLDLLVELAEDEIIQNDRKVKYQKDLIVNLQHEKVKMVEVCDSEEKLITRLQDVLDIIQECDRRSKPGCADAMPLEEYAMIFRHLQENFYEEYKSYELSHLAIALVFPMMESDFQNWQPLSNPRHQLDTIKIWKELIESNTVVRDYQGESQMNTYERLIWEIWMPHVRKAINETWKVRHPDALLEMLEAWFAILPEWVMSNILELLVLPKLQTEVDDWNPLTDTMPIHSWLHPWLPLMGVRLEPLYAPIRHKLANALTNWHPSDPSAKMILDPWKSVFKSGHMDAFVVKYILPKLTLCMQEFTINPHQQHLDAWQWVMRWLDMVPYANMVNLMLKHFFPKWLQVLCTWLGAMPNYTEVTKWYMGWKSMLPEVLANDSNIKEELNKALNIMNRAVSGQSFQAPSFIQQSDRAQYAGTPPLTDAPPVARTVPSASTIPTNFRELLERKAEEFGLLFMPIPNKTWEAKQVYKFGKVMLYLDRSVCFMMERENVWVPVSINTLVERAR